MLLLKHVNWYWVFHFTQWCVYVCVWCSLMALLMLVKLVEDLDKMKVTKKSEMIWLWKVPSQPLPLTFLPHPSWGQDSLRPVQARWGNAGTLEMVIYCLKPALSLLYKVGFYNSLKEK
jgi:hypothetical protein